VIFMFGISEKCPICGMKVKKGKGVQHFGKTFCSEDCAKEYENKMK